MIEFGVQDITLSLPVVRALLEFASTDPTRAHLYAVGFDQGNVCATDGHTAVRFDKATEAEGARPASYYHDKFFSRGYVEQQLKAAGRQGPVHLDWSCLYHHGFPPLSRAEPKDGVTFEDTVMLDTHYLGRLELVARACRRERLPGDKEAPCNPGVVIVSLAGALDPMRFHIGGREWITSSAHEAYVTIMPMRKEGPAKKVKKVKATAIEQAEAVLDPPRKSRKSRKAA